jgi:putative NADH-flavin reductase
MDNPDDILSISVTARGNAVAYGPAREQKHEEHTVPVLIFGATGRTGRYLVERALSKGHTVTAFVRDPHALSVRHPRLHLLEGDVLSPEAVDKAMHGQRVVLSALGFSGRGGSASLVKAMENIVTAMQKYRVHRFICLAPAPAREGWARRGLLGKLLAPFLQKSAAPDWEQQVAFMRGSTLEWVQVRPTRLTDEPSRGSYQVSVGWAEVPEGISRADVATFMIEQLQSRRFVRLSPVLGG